jgi:hypothetical protein
METEGLLFFLQEPITGNNPTPSHFMSLRSILIELNSIYFVPEIHIL